MEKDEKKEKNPARSSHDDKTWLSCCVKNCNAKIKPGTEIKIGDDIYCPECGAIVFKSSLGL